MSTDEFLHKTRHLIGGLIYEVMLMQRRGEAAFGHITTMGNEVEAKIKGWLSELVLDPPLPVKVPGRPAPAPTQPGPQQKGNSNPTSR